MDNLIMRKEFVDFSDKIREELNQEIDRVVEELKQSNDSPEYSRTTPLAWYSMEYSYFVKEIFEKVLGVEYHVDYNSYMCLCPHHEVYFDIGISRIWLNVGKTLEGIREEVISAIHNEYLRVFHQSNWEQEILRQNGEARIESLDKLIDDGTIKEVMQALSEDLYYDENFKNQLVTNEFYVADIDYLGAYKMPYISVEDVSCRLHEIPLYEPKRGNGSLCMEPRSRYDILAALNCEHFTLRGERKKPSTKVLKEQEEQCGPMGYSGYSAEEVRNLFQLGRKSKDSVSELKKKLSEEGYQDEDAFRIAICGLRARSWWGDIDLSVKSWYRFGSPVLSDRGTYLPSLNHLSKSVEDGVSVVDADWLIEYGPWIWDEWYREKGIWEIPGIFMGIGADFEPIIYPVGLAIKTDITTMEELFDAITEEARKETAA